MKRFSTILTSGLVASALLTPPAFAAEAKLAPAPFTPLPVGTVLDYGSWKCTVSASDGSTHVCRGPAGEQAEFYGKLLPYGAIPSNGYGSRMNVINCEFRIAHGKGISRFHDVKSIALTPNDRRALDGLWPLQVGKSILIRRNFQPLSGSAKSTIRVTGTKTVTVLGKTRQVYLLEGETTKVHCAEGSTETIYTNFDEIWWYAPDLAAIVRYELKWADAGVFSNNFSYDLKAITQPKPSMVAQNRPLSQAPTGRVSVLSPPRQAKTLLSAEFPGIHFGTYHAIVIGNNDYRNLTDLKMAVNDARAVAKLLADSYGFDVRLVANATRSNIIRELAKMRARLTPNDNLLVYYAGHGVVDQIAQVGYWLPVDAEDDVPTNWVSTGDLTAMLRSIRAKHVMVVADSCYSGTLVRATNVRVKTARERDAWVKRIVGKRARTALVSGGLEPVEDGGGGEHSVFAKAFLTALSENTGVMDGEALFNAIKRPVVLNSDQTPQYSDIRKSGHEGGDFVFVRR